MDDDSRLVHQALNGDEDAFERLVKRHSPKVAKIASSFFSGRQNVEDLVQEVFLKVYQSLDRFKLDKPFEPWIIRITINSCYDELRRIRKRREVSPSHLSDDEEQWLEEIFESTRNRHSPEDHHLVRIILGRVFDRLPSKDRTTLLLKGEGYSLREIAEVLGCSMQAANLRLFRARRRMLHILRELRILPAERKNHDAL